MNYKLCASCATNELQAELEVLRRLGLVVRLKERRADGSAIYVPIQHVYGRPIDEIPNDDA
ncbi:hypothetical protein [uncultured Nocardioides sp.]|uniref:hypothetical protein n=1 Tax=uncultured Nocardioides sp. TaxID=198441 RepID=UPI0026374D6C|nr:hypothetical protein [uncultured Nocardioides sp.]